MARKYSNVSKTMTLTASVTITDVQIHVDDASGLPNSFPYVIVIDYEQPGVEICLVTAAAGNILTVDRGQEDTAAQPHTLGAVIVHAATAQDLQQAADHLEATTNVHGTGPGNAVVGTGTVQTLTNKSMDGGDNTFTNIPGSAVVGPIAGTITVANVVGDWPIDTRSTGNLPLATRTTGSIPVDTRTTGNLPGSRLASPVTAAMTFSALATFSAGASFTTNASFTTGFNVLTGSSITFYAPCNIYFGSSSGTDTTAVNLSWLRTVGADAYRSNVSIDASGNFEIWYTKNGTQVNRLRLAPDGNILINTSSQANPRYLPYAMSTHVITPLNFNNAASASIAVTFPAGRFTQAPIVTTVSWDANYVTGLNNVTTSGFNAVGRQADNVVHTGATTLSAHAIQMLAASGAGLVAQQTPESTDPQETVTCRTEGCGNEDVPLVLYVPEGSGAMCGVCGKLIEDRQPV